MNEYCGNITGECNVIRLQNMYFLIHQRVIVRAISVKTTKITISAVISVLFNDESYSCNKERNRHYRDNL